MDSSLSRKTFSIKDALSFAFRNVSLSVVFGLALIPVLICLVLAIVYFQYDSSALNSFSKDDIIPQLLVSVISIFGSVMALRLGWLKANGRPINFTDIVSFKGIWTMIKNFIFQSLIMLVLLLPLFIAAGIFFITNFDSIDSLGMSNTWKIIFVVLGLMTGAALSIVHLRLDYFIFYWFEKNDSLKNLYKRTWKLTDGVTCKLALFIAAYSGVVILAMLVFGLIAYIIFNSINSNLVTLLIVPLIFVVTGFVIYSVMAHAYARAYIFKTLRDHEIAQEQKLLQDLSTLADE